MKLNPLSLSLCRTPAFGIEDELLANWPALKNKIQQASPTFYEQIVKTDAQEINALPEKARFTIWKYFNRSKYRATPFADFAGYTLVPMGMDTGNIKIAAAMQSHHFVNWPVKESLSMDMTVILAQSHLLYSNTSVYHCDNELRYLRFNEGVFELASAETFPELVSLMQYCAVKRNPSCVYEFMKTAHQLEKKRCKKLILQLLNLQLLHSDSMANITGEDYFKRLKLPFTADLGNYILAERKLLDGWVASSKADLIAEALQFIAQLLPASHNTGLLKFKSAFLRKFEHQEVSLAMVMDPELGIGYGNSAQYVQDDELVEYLENSTKQGEVNPSLGFTEMHRFLINGVLENGSIALDKFQSSESSHEILPNTLSVRCHFYKNHAVIAHAGGCTANALLGRFTLGSNPLKEHCQEIANREQNANPDVLFFDIAYQAEASVDNVNRRKNCYAYELPILTWSCLDAPLDFNDIMVSVKADEIMLFSKRLGKRLIPRLASAYNYTRSDLSVYRFLCDLQHQSIQTNLIFDFQRYLPGLIHYPRVSYKNVIVSPAQWLLPKSVYQKNCSTNENLTMLSYWLQSKNIDFLFKAGISDQTLCFNPTSITDLWALLSYCKQQRDRPIYLTEALIDLENNVIDENGKKYAAEFIINYCHDKRIYRPINPNTSPEANQPFIQTHYQPGSEWLYFEIFISPRQTNRLLCKEIKSLLGRYKNEIVQWFFIRYNENGHHLRLRLMVRNVASRAFIIDNLNQSLAVYLTKGVVSDMVLRSYRPEIARYGAARMTLIEQFFYLDSQSVLLLLVKKPVKDHLYLHVIRFFQKITAICFPLFVDGLVFAKKMAETYAGEFNIGIDGFKRINSVYGILEKSQKAPFVPYEKKIKQMEYLASTVFNACASEEKSKMLADLLHMHVNRVFNDNQRLHEAICYQFFYKQLLTERARLSPSKEHPMSA